MSYYCLRLLISWILLFPCSFVMAQSHKEEIEAWEVLGVTSEQVKRMKSAQKFPPNATAENFMDDYRNTLASISAPTKHTLILQDAVFPSTETIPVAMSPDRKRFYVVQDSRLIAYSMPSGRRLWENSANLYTNNLLATNDGVFAEYFDPLAHRLYGSGTGAGGIHFVNIKNKIQNTVAHASMIPAMSKDGVFLALKGETFDEILVLNTKSFEVKELPIDKGLFKDNPALEDWQIPMLYYENISAEEYNTTREKFWAKDGIEPLTPNSLKLEDMYVHYTRPKDSIPSPTLKIQATALSAQKEYAFAGDSPYIFTLPPLTGQVASHTLEDTISIQLLSFSADGKVLVALNDTGILHIYKDSQWQQIATGIQETVNYMTVNLQGDAVWLAKGSTLYYISLKTSAVRAAAFSSDIRELAFSSKAQRAIILTQEEPTGIHTEFIPIANTDTAIKSYDWEKMQALCMVIPTLEEKQILSFTGNTLLLRNAFAYTKVAEGTRMSFSYDILSTPKKITIENDPEYFSMNHMYSIASFHEITPNIYARAEDSIQEDRDLLTVFDVSQGSNSQVFTMPKSLYSNVPGFSKVYFTQKGTFMSVGLDNKVMLWDITQYPIMPLLTYNFFTDGNYVVINKDGKFFSPYEEKLAAFHWIYNDAPSKIIDFKKLADTYRDKDIVQKALQK